MQDTKQILLFTHHLMSGGAEKAVRTLAEYMNQHCQGYRAIICVVYDDADEHRRLENAGVPVLVMQNRSETGDSKVHKGINVLRQIREMRRVKRDYKIDVCVSFLSGADIINVLSRVGERQIVSIRNEESRFVHNVVQKWYRKIAYLKCDRIIAVSKRAAVDTIRYFGVHADKVIAIPNAIQEAPTDNVNDQRYLSFIDGRYVFINVARLFYAKGQDLLIRAFSRVHKIYPDTGLALVGGGPEEEFLRSLVAELGIEDAVYFAGMQQNPHWYMSQANAFVLSSHAEGMPNVILEAMRARLPVISTDCGAREILSPETDSMYQTNRMDLADYGILIPIGNEETMAEAMQYLITHPEIAERYRVADAQRIANYSMESVMAQWCNELDRLVHQ